MTWKAFSIISFCLTGRQSIQLFMAVDENEKHKMTDKRKERTDVCDVIRIYPSSKLLFGFRNRCETVSKPETGSRTSRKSLKPETSWVSRSNLLFYPTSQIGLGQWTVVNGFQQVRILLYSSLTCQCSSYWPVVASFDGYNPRQKSGLSFIGFGI